jgi:alpha-amylase
MRTSLYQTVQFLSLLFSSQSPLALAATASEWKGRAIYQYAFPLIFGCLAQFSGSRVIVDRYALPEGADPTKCDPGDRTWCGGTWNTSVSLEFTSSDLGT